MAFREDKRQSDEILEGEETGGSGILREILSWILYLLAVLVITYLIITYIGQRTVVEGESMMPTLEDQNNLIVDKITYRFREPERFEIIVFTYRYKAKTHYIKRVIGLPGETVQIIGNDIYINGEILEENYGAEPMESAGLAAEPITLGEGEYFVLGDNRNHSSDSRAEDVGVIQKSEIIGRAWLRVWPFNEFGILKHQ